MEKKIVKRDFFEAFKAMALDGNMHIEDFAEGVTDEMVVEFCDNEIALLDKKAAKAKETAAKKKTEDPLTAVIKEVLTNEFEAIADIAARIEGEDITVSKVSYRLSQLVKAGFAEKEEISVKDGDGKSRRIMAYRIAVEGETPTEQ